ncbi:hypothetical protein [Pontibacter harenae]|uniref:hypothetical protein n=1 Tax=Pontibacter harenae TaxID=2894083 RepID=UPI001E29AAA8|nr:hypothetical protein [Pontibacter harenae]MCC9168041.1 hypothetical protein [Pontibacter harenae]
MKYKELYMTQQQEQLEALQEIRSIMDRSSRFISLSGVAGIFAGISALAGAGAVLWYFNKHNLQYQNVYSSGISSEAVVFLAVVAALVFLLAVSAAIYFSARKAQKVKQSIWHSQGQRLVLNLCIPLAVGGAFCLVLLYHDIIYLVAPAMLIFYGLSLINSSKYTFRDIRYLGFCDVVLGLLACFFIQYGFVAWVLGFGVLHIIYGAVMYYKYEKS